MRALKAIVFDVDGTLYRQDLLRRAMLRRLLAAHAVHPVAGWQTLSMLRAYRHAQEQLRGHVSADVGAAQINLTCEHTNLDRTLVVECIQRWMEQEPLAFLSRCIQPGLVTFLDACRSRGLRLGALSDYPAADKLTALGVARYFDVAVSAQDTEIGVFKPDPQGLRVALQRLRSTPVETLYVGDRVDVDATLAVAAGVPCAILTRGRPPNPIATHFQVTDYSQLHSALFGPDEIGTPQATR